MPAKTAAKAAAKKPKKPVSSKAKNVASTPQTLVAHWLQDASIESFAPAQQFAPGSRQVDFSVRANQATVQHPTLVRAELRLRAHIHADSQPLALAEVKYAGVVEKTRMENAAAEVLAEIYPHARASLASLLQLAGHQPPLPERLEPHQPVDK